MCVFGGGGKSTISNEETNKEEQDEKVGDFQGFLMSLNLVSIIQFFHILRQQMHV